MRFSICLFLAYVGLHPAALALNLTVENSATTQLAQVRQQRLSLSEAADLVRRRTGGRVLSAQSSNEQGREMYRIKVLTSSGEVRVVLVDAASGGME